MRRQMNKVLGNRARQVWGSLVALPFGRRARLAWMLLRGQGPA
jgi:hypothetical protein